MNTSEFVNRHISLNETNKNEMLKKIGVSSIDELVSQTIPHSIRLQKDLSISEPLSEFEMLSHSKELASENQQFDSYIGLGYHPAILPAVIQRNILENPSWYTAYTPYQAEISQGRLEALLNYQTMIVSLTGFPLANASLLDEGTAAAEAMHMFFSNRTKEQKNAGANKFFISDDVLPQTIAVLKTRAEGLGIEITIGEHSGNLDHSYFGILLQYPTKIGVIEDYTEIIKSLKEQNIQVVLACDLLALVMLKSPAQLDADCAVGTSQRFGIPMGYGGPHAAFYACKDEYKREIPGRIIGVSQDMYGKRALRMALQTREQHIKREKATSNICTAQVLLAVMAGMYAVYHGEAGLKHIAGQIHFKTNENMRFRSKQFDKFQVISFYHFLNYSFICSRSVQDAYFTFSFAYIFYNFICLGFTQCKIVFVFSKLLDYIYKGIYSKGIMLGRYRKSSCYIVCFFVLLLQQICLLQNLSCIPEKPVTFMGNNYSFICPVEN